MPVRSDTLSLSNLSRQLKTNNPVFLLLNIKNNLYDKISTSNCLASFGYKNNRSNSVIESLRPGVVIAQILFLEAQV